jgi:hypothetical protein
MSILGPLRKYQRRGQRRNDFGPDCGDIQRGDACRI